jgi:tight adherence protein C
MHALKSFYYLLIDNFDYFGVLIFAFIAVVAIVFAIVTLFSKRQTEAEGRLSKLVDKPGKEQDGINKPKFLDRESDSLAAKVSRPLQKMSALEERTSKNRLRLKLIQAGYRSDSAIYNFLAMKILMMIILVGIYMVSMAFYTFAPEMILFALFLAILGYFTPNLRVWLMTLARQERIFKGLPDALDLMVVCVEAGLGLDMTFKRVGEEVRPLCKDLSDEFILTNLEVRAGTQRDEAFKNMSLRTGVAEVNNLMTVLSQTSRFGTSLATALRIHADAMRVKRRQIAEETAAKATVKLIFPLVLFIFPAIFVVLIGPGAIKIVKVLFPALGG